LSTSIGPKLNNSQDLLPTNFLAEEKPLPKILPANEASEDSESMESIMRKIMTAANGFGIFATGASVLTRATNYQQSKGKETFFDKLAAFAVKSSMGINSLYNVFNGVKQKSIFDTFGFLGELIIASAAPYKYVNLLRGLTFCLYQTPQFLTSNLVGGELPVSKTWSENFNILTDRLPKAFKHLFSKDTYKLSELKNNSGLITGMWGGIFSVLGVGFWSITGDSKIGGAVKGIGEGLVDLFQVIPKEHWTCKRTNYIKSGMSFIAGTASDIASRLMSNEPVTRDLSFFFSGIGRWFMSLSKAKQEYSFGPGGIINKKADITSIPHELAKNSATEAVE
jgi:hypothetical protein